MLHNVKESVDKDGNVTITGSTFQNPHVVAALVGTKSVSCETRAIGEELQFVIKLGVTKSIHDTKAGTQPSFPPPNTLAPGMTPAEAKQQAELRSGAKPDVVHPAPVPEEVVAAHAGQPYIAPPKPGTQAPIPAEPEKSKTA